MEVPLWPRKSKDNLERATKSIGRNFAEGAGKWLLADKIHFYQISRGSGTEGAASLDQLVDSGLVQPERIVRAKGLAWRIVNMLTGMIRKLESMPQRANAAAPKANPPSARAGARARARLGPGPGRG